MWHAMPNMESLLNYNPVNLLWTYQKAMSLLKTFFRSKSRNKPITVAFITTLIEMKSFLYPFIVQKSGSKRSKSYDYDNKNLVRLKAAISKVVFNLLFF